MLLLPSAHAPPPLPYTLTSTPPFSSPPPPLFCVQSESMLREAKDELKRVEAENQLKQAELNKVSTSTAGSTGCWCSLSTHQ